jgi:hypothetical protein
VGLRVAWDAERPQSGKLHQEDYKKEINTASHFYSLTGHSIANRVPESNRKKMEIPVYWLVSPGSNIKVIPSECNYIQRGGIGQFVGDNWSFLGGKRSL